MKKLHITDHSLAGWSAYGETVGFVPDPMILRTGEIFLNGAQEAKRIRIHDTVLWEAVRANLGGLLDFFDMLVTRDTIPLINYRDSFKPGKIAETLEGTLPALAQAIEIHDKVYNEIKQGALLNVARLAAKDLKSFGEIASELDAFRYEWDPGLHVFGHDPKVRAAHDKLTKAGDEARLAILFLLGGFVFSSIAQASQTTHYIQPKRARFFLGLTAARDRAGNFSRGKEAAIFKTAAARLKGSRAEARNADPIPPVLPYLLQQGKNANVRDLLRRALDFRETAEGKRYRSIVDDIRADGLRARRADDRVKKIRQEGLAFLAPHSKLDKKRSGGLHISFSARTVGLPVQVATRASFKPRIPTWLRLWWNDKVPFGGVNKTFRRMWMATDSYTSLETELGRLWAKPL
jgi:hypothetical protein